MVHRTSLGIDNRKFCMWVVICSECMLFGTLIINYIIHVNYIKQDATLDLIKPANIINVPVTSISTFVLLMSSLGMVLCLAGIVENDLPRFRKWCLATALLGATFLGFQVFEFTEFYLKGLSLGANVFGSSFFTLTGCHGIHVAVGVMLLMTLYFRSLKPGFHSDTHGTVVETIGLYWHFVDVIWIIIFTLVYLFVLAP